MNSGPFINKQYITVISNPAPESGSGLHCLCLRRSIGSTEDFCFQGSQLRSPRIYDDCDSWVVNFKIYRLQWIVRTLKAQSNAEPVDDRGSRIHSECQDRLHASCMFDLTTIPMTDPPRRCVDLLVDSYTNAKINCAVAEGLALSQVVPA
ncbi:hypothetical protein J6590_043628 [Homalodisca vitripennis]|nr:hypothetical protein J6590_043628 [Homalodisca vitripennis]